jgi:hypothetical protein
MLNEIRVVFACAVILISTATAQQAPQIAATEPAPALENAYVKVILEPPVSPTGKRTLNLCFNLTDFPFVRLYLPTQKTDASDQTNQHGVFAGYVSKGEPFGCTAQVDGSFVYVDLKSAPTKSKFDDDAVKLDHKHNEILFENDRIRVVRVQFCPGESGPIVDKRPRVIIAVTDSLATVTFPDGHSEARDMRAGTVSFGSAGRQATKNTGTTPLENIVVELKSKDAEKK